MSKLKLQLVVIIVAVLENLYLKASKTQIGVFKLLRQNNETLFFIQQILFNKTIILPLKNVLKTKEIIFNLLVKATMVLNNMKYNQNSNVFYSVYMFNGRHAISKSKKMEYG
jgi:hypothetical protein